MASASKFMDSGEICVRIRGLTGDTENAFYLTLLAMVYIIKKLLDVAFYYVLPGEFQSYHLEGEFSSYHCPSGRNCLITWKQVVNSTQRLTRYHN